MNQFIRKAVSGIILLILLSFSFFAYGESSVWDCPECGRTGNTGNYCGGCAHPAPWIESSTDPAPTDTSGYVSSLPSVREGDIITFGTYPQMKEGNDQTPIEWIVLDYDEANHKALLLSKYGLDAKPYYTGWTDVTWEKCTLREWLNGEFLNKAFSAKEQSAILITDVDNSPGQGNTEWNTDSGNNTQDRIFLLSYNQARHYLSATLKGSNKNNIRITPTAYAIGWGAWTSASTQTEEGTAAGWWWLRSPGYSQRGAANVRADGSLGYTTVTDKGGTIRPALWLNLESDN